VTVESELLRGRKRATWGTQFRILSGRAFKNMYRDPALLTFQYSASIAAARESLKYQFACFLYLTMTLQCYVDCSTIKCLMILVDSKIDWVRDFRSWLVGSLVDVASAGVFFFTLALFGFSCLSSLGLFANERILFMRERCEPTFTMAEASADRAHQQRSNGYYSSFTYFTSKVCPISLLVPWADIRCLDSI